VEPDDTAADLVSMMPLCSTLGMRTISRAKELVEIALDWKPELCTTLGVLHGGVLMALADSAGATCAFLHLPEGALTSTIESKTNFLGAVRDGTVIASARPLHVGRTTIVVETEVRNAGEKGNRLVAKVTQTQAVLQPR
jgi:1,4-dihydroxy-2-naphthoyl-CoA hydrolase